MKLFLSSLLLIVMSLSAFPQTSLLGSNYRYVVSKLDEDPEFLPLKPDTLANGNIAIKCKSNVSYPYFIYEFSREGECVSYTLVGKNRQVFSVYTDFLYSVGELVSYDDDRRIFHVRTMQDEVLIYTVSEPFKDSDLMSKRGVFTVQIEKKNL